MIDAALRQTRGGGQRSLLNGDGQHMMTLEGNCGTCRCLGASGLVQRRHGGTGARADHEVTGESGREEDGSAG